MNPLFLSHMACIRNELELNQICLSACLDSWQQRHLFSSTYITSMIGIIVYYISFIEFYARPLYVFGSNCDVNIDPSNSICGGKEVKNGIKYNDKPFHIVVSTSRPIPITEFINMCYDNEAQNWFYRSSMYNVKCDERTKRNKFISLHLQAVHAMRTGKISIFMSHWDQCWWTGPNETLLQKWQMAKHVVGMH